MKQVFEAIVYMLMFRTTPFVPQPFGFFMSVLMWLCIILLVYLPFFGIPTFAKPY